MNFLQVNVTFYDAVSVIHDIIITPNPYPFTAKFVFVSVMINKDQQMKLLKINKIRTYCCRISKISNSVGRKDNCLAKPRQSSILPTSLDIFDIRQHYVRIVYT